MSYQLLYASKFIHDVGTTAYDSSRINNQAQQSYSLAARQTAINNNLNFDAHLALNEQQALTLKKYGLGRFELLKKRRREEARSAVQSTQRGLVGGTPNEVGGSFAASYNNVTRYANLALARKDLNQDLINDLKRRHKNIDLTTISQNNIAFSKISQGADIRASALSIIGSGLQIGIDMESGTTSRGTSLYGAESTRGFGGIS